MFIPRYWSEAAHLERLPGRRQVTVRRFGWSATSQEEADVHARQRLEEALVVLRSGGPDALRHFTRQERRVAYSGSDGLPIREEIVQELPALDVVVTRNSYGALCLNTPKAMFVDVDRPWASAAGWGVLAFLVGAVVGAVFGKRLVGSTFLGIVLVGSALAFLANVVVRVRRALSRRMKDVLSWSLDQVRAWCDAHPTWRVAVYETPAGVRLLALHAEFDAAGEEARAFMDHVRADALYRRMCELQRCFRARVSPKPWRAGIPDHFKAGGVWPVGDPARLARRREWVARYDAARRDFASCRFVEEVGGGVADRRVEQVRRVHDDLAGAATGRRLA